MIHRWHMFAILVCAAAAPAQAAPVEPPAATLLEGPAWKAPAAGQVKAQALAWLDGVKVDQPTRAKAEALWADATDELPPDQVLGRLAKTFALADENARKLMELCSGPKTQPVLPSQPWLADEKTPPFLARNLRLFYGVWLAQESLLDESLEQIGELKPGEVVDPASLLFYQGVACHGLLQKERGLKAIRAILDAGQQSPRRYAALAQLMEADLKDLKDDSLDHIARRMRDIERRLDLGRAGPRVRKIEDGVIESLDKLIKELEEQQQQQQQASSSGGNMQPSSPAPDSRIMGGKGPGEVAKKNIGSSAGWGDLPPKQREEAMQQIGREFPSHYRDVIEQYFRRLAAEGSDQE